MMSVVERAKEAHRARLTRERDEEGAREARAVEQARIAFYGLFAEAPEEAFYEFNHGPMIRHEGLVFRGHMVPFHPGAVRYFKEIGIWDKRPSWIKE